MSRFLMQSSRAVLVTATVALIAGCGLRVPASTSTTAKPVATTAHSTSPVSASASATTEPVSVVGSTTTPVVTEPTATVAPTAVPSTTAGPDAATAVAQITANWERFFLPTTSIADRTALLENGASLHDALVQRAADPLQQQASAKVTAVSLTASDRAAVTYDVSLSGTVALTAATGVSVFQDGVWKVSADSFCALIALGSTAPIPGCS